MSSKTSLISLFVLVLAACCYSLPVQDQFQSSTSATPIFELSTGTTIVEHEVKVNMRLISPEESTDIPNFHSEHMPTGDYKTHDEVSRPSRLSEEMSSKLTTQSPSSFHLTHDERSLNEYTTMESKTKFGMRQEEETETPQEVPQRSFPGQEHRLEMTTISEPLASTSFDFHPREFTTSVDSFGKYTGLLNADETTETMKFEQSTAAMKVEKDDHSMEETSSRPQQLVKTISVIPGKITETQIFGNGAYFMRQPEQQLTQGSTLLLFLLAALLFCACMMASVIAIVKSSQSLKRRSRITEMEADLDKNYHHYEK